MNYIFSSICNIFGYGQVAVKTGYPKVSRGEFSKLKRIHKRPRGAKGRDYMFIIYTVGDGGCAMDKFLPVRFDELLPKAIAVKRVIRELAPFVNDYVVLREIKKNGENMRKLLK